MKNILQNFKGKDKLLHSMCGNVIFVLLFSVFWWLYSAKIAFAMAVCGVLLIGLAKELYDKYIKCTFIDWYDIVAAFIPYPLIKYIQKL